MSLRGRLELSGRPILYGGKRCYSTSMITIGTHSGSFHSDDVFAVAALQLLLGVKNTEVIRTRDEAVLASLDYVLDVGGVYDHEAKRYDHHQLGVPVRENGLPYAAFGLIWKHYGEALCGSAAVAESIERQLVLPIDAGDNGISLYTAVSEDLPPFGLYQFVRPFAPAWGSDASYDAGFREVVAIARRVLELSIVRAKAERSLQEYIKEVYEAAQEKFCLVFERSVPSGALLEYPEVKVVVTPDESSEAGNWKVTCVQKGFEKIEGGVLFPEAWAGLRDEALATVSQIPDAVFCHKGRFFFVAGSKESALRAAGMVG